MLHNSGSSFFKSLVFTTFLLIGGGFILSQWFGSLDEVSGLRRQVADLTAQRDTLAQQVDSLKQERDGLTGQVAALTAQLKTKTKQSNELALERDGLTGQVNSLAAERDGLRQRLADLQTQQNKLLVQMNGLTAERDNLARQLDATKTAGLPIPVTSPDNTEQLLLKDVVGWQPWLLITPVLVVGVIAFGFAWDRRTKTPRISRFSDKDHNKQVSVKMTREQLDEFVLYRRKQQRPAK